MNPQKTVLFTVDVFDISGVITLSQQYIGVLHRQGYNTVIVGREGNIVHPEKYFPHTEVFLIPGAIADSLIGRCIDGAAYLRFLQTVYRRHTIRAVHMSTPWSALYTLLHPATWKTRRIITFHGAYDLESISARNTRPTITNRIGDAIRFFIQWLSLIGTHSVICCSSYSKNLMRKHFPFVAWHKKDIFIIPGYAKAATSLTHRKDHPQKTLQILNIGRAEPRKGIPMLLSACASLLKKHVPLNLSLASPVDRLKTGNVLDVYERLQLFSYVRFYHAASGEQKRSLMAAADVFVMPSLDLETFGLTVLESLAEGLPVIGTPVGAIPEILRKVDNRLITRTTSSSALEKTLLWYTGLPLTERVAIQKKALTCVQQHYSYRHIAPKILSVYEAY